MAILKKKTRKRLAKELRKLVKKHGEEVVTGLVTTAVSAAAAKFASNGEDQPKKGKKGKKRKEAAASSVGV